MPGAPGHTSSRGVLELDLGADKLAQIVRFARSAEVRLVDVGSGSVRRLSRVGVGEGGQSFVGVGFAGARLGCALNCLVSCQPLRAGIYRYRLSTGTLVRADPPRQLGGAIIGLALFAADGAYVIEGEPQAGAGGLGRSRRASPLPADPQPPAGVYRAR